MNERKIVDKAMAISSDFPKTEEIIDMNDCINQPLVSSAMKLKPRAIILLANEKDLEKVKDFIKTLGEVKLVYLTTAPSSTALRVIKEPKDRQPFEQALFTLETGL
jgi:hypothetical protein